MTRFRTLPVSALWVLCLAGTAGAQQLTFAPYHADGVYNVGETVGWTVTPDAKATLPLATYKWTIRRNNQDVLKSGTLDLSSGSEKIEVPGTEPEMIYAEFIPDAPSDRGGNTGKRNGRYAVGAAVSPAKIGISTPRPADFDAFWDGKLKALAAIPIHPVITPATSPVPGVELSTFVLDSVGSHAQGYIAKPAKEGKFPALVVLQWAGVYALNPRSVAMHAADGWLTIDVDAHNKPPTDAAGAPRNYAAVGDTDRETSYFLDMYLRDARAIDYLKTRSDWDGHTIVLLGTSMGGQQSIVTAGLRPDDITAVLVCVPSGADTNGDLHGRKAGYPNWKSDDPKIMETALYFDTVNFASRIKAPVVAAMGFIDTTSPPAGVWTELNQIPGPKEALPMIESEHNNLTPQKEANWDARSKEVLGLLVRGEKFVPDQQYFSAASKN